MPDIALPITSLTAVVLATVLLLLTCKVITLRRRDGVVLGDNDDRVLTKAIRGQGNASEQVPLGLIMLGLCELQGASFGLLAMLATIFVVGRVMHAVYFAVHGTPWPLRLYGMLLTLVAQTGLIIMLLMTVVI